MRGGIKRPLISVEEAVSDENIFGKVFRPREDWFNWIVLMKSCFGEELSPEEIEVFRTFTGRRTYPGKRFSEVWLCIGRRGGKSRVLSAMAVYLAFFCDWKDYLSPGERAFIPIVAADQKQADVIFNYIKGITHSNPLMRKLVQRDTLSLFELSNDVVIGIQTASYRTIRGPTVVAALFDEMAFWHHEGANPDEEIVRAVRPGMVTIPGAMLFCASSPFYERGVFYDHIKRYYAVEDDDVLVWKAATWEMNPTVPSEFLEREKEKDPVSFASEYGAEFRSGSYRYVPKEAVDDCTDFGVSSRPPDPSRTYRCFVDPSGGAADSFAAAVAHDEGEDAVVVDAIVEFRPPFDPSEVVAEIAALCRRYGISTVHGDRYAGMWPQSVFAKHGIVYEASPQGKSDLYRSFLPLLMSRRVRLVDHGVLRHQLLSLERRARRGGVKEIIDHPRGMHDDVANAVAGVCVVGSNVAEERVDDELPELSFGFV